jgi:hypothetical protein
MRYAQTYRGLLLGTLTIVFAVSLWMPTSAGAFQVVGKVVNGTTDNPVHPATILVVRPSGGMLTEREVHTMDDQGRFTIDDLDDEAPVYLLRVSFQGVNYTELVRFDGNDPFTMEINVYELTTSWDDVRVTVPHFMLMGSPDTLTVNKYTEITNSSSPPRTIHGDDARFVLYLPEDAIEINALNVRSLSVPLPVTPHPTGEPGAYSIDYPIKPGRTTVEVSFDLPYGDSQYTYTEPLRYDVDEMRIIAQDPAISVTSSTVDVGPSEEFHGFKSYKLADLTGGDALTLTFSGGASSAPPPAGSDAHVLVIPSRAWNLALGLMIVLIITLIGFLLAMVGKGPSKGVESEVLRSQKEDLLNQLAKLDDLHKTGTVSDQLYRMKRGELINALAEIYYRTTFKEMAEPQEETPKKGAARV